MSYLWILCNSVFARLGQGFLQSIQLRVIEAPSPTVISADLCPISNLCWER